MGSCRSFVPPALLALMLLTAPPALAQDGATAPPSPQVATQVSLWSTVVLSLAGGGLASSSMPEAGGVLLVTGIVVGPGTGYLYGGRAGRGFAGMGYRVLFGGVMLLGFGAAWGASEGSGDMAGPEAIMLVGALGILGSAGYDIAVVGRTVRRHNATRTVGLTPWRSRDGAPGLALRATF